MMMAARGLQSRQSRANNAEGLAPQQKIQQFRPPQEHLLAQQQLSLPHHRSMQAPLSLSRMQQQQLPPPRMQQQLPQQLQAPLLPSRKRLPSRAMMLWELEEKLEKEISAAEAEAASYREDLKGRVWTRASHKEEEW